jgi:hypothetical protein
MSDLLNFGFDPTGAALGSEGSPSMPSDPLTGMEHPMDANMAQFDDFVMQTQRRYGDVSDPGGTIYDPRGERALSSKPSDYRDTDMMRPDEIPVQLSGSDDQLFGGDPVLAPYNPDSSGMAQALYDMDIGFSPQGAATLADSLGVYDPKILEGIKIPRTVEPRVTNELGLATEYGGLPDAFFDPSSGVVKNGVPEAVDRVIAQSGRYQYVDPNGVVNKYAPGTSPYDAIGEGRMAGLRMGQPGTPFGGQTPAQIRKFGGALGQSARSAGSSLSSANQSLNPTDGPATATDGDSGGGDLPSDLGGASAGSYSPNTGGYNGGSGEEGYVTTNAVGDEAAPEKKYSKWWWLLALVPVAAGGIYYATRKKKRGKK